MQVDLPVLPLAASMFLPGEKVKGVALLLAVRITSLGLDVRRRGEGQQGGAFPVPDRRPAQRQGPALAMLRVAAVQVAVEEGVEASVRPCEGVEVALAGDGVRQAEEQLVGEVGGECGGDGGMV